MENLTVTRGVYSKSTDKSRLDLLAVHKYLSGESYWSPNIPFEIVKKAAENSLTFGIFHEDQQIGYARIVSDFASFAYLADVYVLEAHRRQGLSKWLMETIQAHPELQGLRRWMLATRDAHGLYAQFGWKPLNNPSIVMEIYTPDIYTQQKA